VIARASAEAVRGQTPQQIGRALKVRYIVEGSVTPEDGQFRVTASLVDAATAAQLWTGAFDRPSASFVKLRVEIGHQIANALNFKLDEIESVRSMHERPNRPDAMDSFLRARSVLDRDHSLAGFEAAGALLEQALAEQPDFPEAQAELGWMLLRKVQTVHDPNEVADYRRAKTVIGQAIAASPLNTRALAARAREYQIEGDCTAAKAEVDRALALNASSLEARTVAASCALSELRFDDAADIYGQILQLDPVSPSSRPRYLSLGLIRLIQGRPAEATLVLNRARGDEAAQPNDTGPAEQAELFLIAAAAMDGRLQQARDAFESYNRTYPHRTIWRIGALLPPAWLKINGVLTILKALGGGDATVR
jgi:tetratricopeptide (TPR) repeat protein